MPTYAIPLTGRKRFHECDYAAADNDYDGVIAWQDLFTIPVSNGETIIGLVHLDGWSGATGAGEGLRIGWNGPATTFIKSGTLAWYNNGGAMTNDPTWFAQRAAWQQEDMFNHAFDLRAIASMVCVVSADGTVAFQASSKTVAENSSGVYSGTWIQWEKYRG
jgi:hypothetical protein